MLIEKASPEPRRISALDTMYPSSLQTVHGATAYTTATTTAYGYVFAGSCRVVADLGVLTLGAGSYFCAPGVFRLEVEGTAVVIERLGFRGLFAAGCIEAKGRLAYIDGCSDTLLVYPPRLGDPVLNHLHFPIQINQSVHSHPSIRLGVVARGHGVAHGPGWEHPLSEGDAFLLGPHEMHAFRTGQSTMDVIAYHPDGDWGPTDENHPMLNRTYLRASLRDRS